VLGGFFPAFFLQLRTGGCSLSARNVQGEIAEIKLEFGLDSLDQLQFAKYFSLLFLHRVRVEEIAYCSS
jgi:hypothetical protein